jgi:hypothetical protein
MYVGEEYHENQSVLSIFRIVNAPSEKVRETKLSQSSSVVALITQLQVHLNIKIYWFG